MNKKVYLAMYKAKGNWIDYVIRFFTHSRFSHCELVIAEQHGQYRCFSSSPRDQGVRQKLMSLPQEKWQLIDVSNKISRDQLVTFFNATKGKRYDFLGAIGIVLLLRQDTNKYFCSEWCAKALGYTRSWSYSPGNLYEVLKCNR